MMMPSKWLMAGFLSLGVLGTIVSSAGAQQALPGYPAPGSSPRRLESNPPLLGVPQPGVRSNRTSVTVVDRDFMFRAAQGNLAEIQLSQLALQRSNNAQIRQYAQQMITDHSRVNQEMSNLAAAKGVNLPRQLDSQHQGLFRQLQQTPPARFDAAYMEIMVGDHAKTEALFQSYLQRGQDADVKALVARTLPPVQAHLLTAQRLIQSARR